MSLEHDCVRVFAVKTEERIVKSYCDMCVCMIVKRGVPWCGGYHVCFTRRRSRVRNSPGPYYFLMYSCSKLECVFCFFRFC